MNAKKPNAHVPAFSATTGNAHEMIVHMNQCVKQPSACPFARTAFGNTSLMYTQITAPELHAKNAMNPRMPTTASVALHLSPSESCHATSECMRIISEAPPMIITRRPNLSMMKNARIVKKRFTVPTPIVPASEAISLSAPKIMSKMRGA